MISISQMDQWLVHYQVACRLGFFLLIFSVLAWIEQSWPWRPWIVPRRIRWMRHFSLTCLSKLCIRLIFPIFAVTYAQAVLNKNIGILHHENWPYACRVILGVMALDAIMYLQHRLFHKYQLLWRIHRVHHMDKQLDVSTGLRFHPLEELINMGTKLLAIAFLGALPLSVLIFEILFNGMVMFAHLNTPIKFSKDVRLRRIIVTPGMHRIHHSDHAPETNSNYGFIFSWWDKLFGSYTLIAQAGERKLVFGLEGFRDDKFQTLKNILQIPFNPKHLKLRPTKKPRLKLKEKDKLPQA
ncbi:MAG: sterol desaturase family protein [Proteobacteria bacterium]|nr:sterol desaturase family protein [Pseudomonadota bacterium]